MACFVAVSFQVAIPEVFLVLRFGRDSTPVVPDILIEKSFCASSVLWSEHFLINPSLAELFPLREQEGCPRSLLLIVGQLGGAFEQLSLKTYIQGIEHLVGQNNYIRSFKPMRVASPSGLALRLLMLQSNKVYSGKLRIPSFQRFFYQNSQNMTFYQFLCKILTNKSTRKKIQLVEGTKEINSNNFHHNWRSLRCLNKLKCVTQVYSTILGHCFYCFWQPIRRQLLKAWQAADQ